MSQYLFLKPGRSLILQTFTNNAPMKFVTKLQSELGLASSCVSVLPFIDALHETRASAYKHLFESLKDKLEDALRGSDQDALLRMLQTCFKYITVVQLRSILVCIFTKLESIPIKYLRDLGNPKLRSITQEFPLDLRRKVWEVDTAYFKSVARDGLQACADITPLHRRPDSPISILCQQIGSSLRLFETVATLISEQAAENKSWATYMHHVLMSLQETGNKIPELGKLFSLALLIDAANRTNSLDVSAIDSIFEILDSLVQSQDRYELMLKKVSVSHAKTTHPPASLKETLSQGNLDASTQSPLLKKQNIKCGAVSPPLLSSMSITNTAVQMTENVEIGPSSPSMTQTKWTTEELSSVLESAYAYLQKIDKYGDFKYPVTESIAPGYFDIVSHPTDLSTIGSKLSKYTSLDEFDADVKLMIDNCLAYNNHTSPIVQDAKDIWKKWQNKKRSLSLLSPQQTTKPAKSQKLSKSKPLQCVQPLPASATLKVDGYCTDQSKQLKGDALSDALENAWSFLSNYDSTLGCIFAAPVTDDIAPNYSSIIVSPMDLGTMQSKLFKYKSIADFENDLKLMLDNCITFNGALSDYGNVAIKFWKKWNASKQDLFAGRLIELNNEDSSAEDMGEEESPTQPPRLMTKRSRAKHVNPEDDNFETESDEEDDYRPKPKKVKRTAALVQPLSKRKKSSASIIPQFAPIHNLSKTVKTPAKSTSVPGHEAKTVPPALHDNMNTKRAIEALPAIQTKGKLLWALIALCDENFQSLLLSRLCIRLHSTTSKSRLPFGDRRLEFLVQLCLLPTYFTGNIVEVSPFFVRVALPVLVARTHFSRDSPIPLVPENVVKMYNFTDLSAFLDALSAKLELTV